MNRYYLHGDLIEEEKDLFYCDSCQLFVKEDHFKEIKHFNADDERYYKSLREWEILRKKYPNQYFRPEGTLNLFDHLVHKIPAKKGHFYKWLIKQKKRDDPIGDLALDVKRDKSFPIATESLKELESYLFHKMAIDEAIQALNEAYKEFKQKKPRDTISLSLRFDIFRRDNYKCQICGRSIPDGIKLEIDHKVPVKKGGKTDATNLWTLCFDCNRGKATKNL
jgi:uncharacterized protein YozE (UPF0346 family)